MVSFKTAVQRGLASADLRLVRANHPGARYLDRVPGSPLDFLIHWLFPDPRGLRFLQIGAHDGVRNDPLYRWIGDAQWTGCLVEPMPDYAARLRRLYADNPRIEVLECAIAAGSGSMQLYRLDPNATGLPDWAPGVATLDAARAAAAAKDLDLAEDCLVAITVRTLAMSELLRRFPSGGPAIVAIDTEGHDLQLASALFDTGCHPALLHFEHACATDEDRWAFMRRLHALGYETMTHGPDTTAYRQP